MLCYTFNKSSDLIIFILFVHVYICDYISHICMPSPAIIRYWILWYRSYRLLWTMQYWSWKPNSSSGREGIILKCCFISIATDYFSNYNFISINDIWFFLYLNLCFNMINLASESSILRCSSPLKLSVCEEVATFLP